MAQCECGCGQETAVATKTSTAQGRVKGHPNRFILGHHNRLRPKLYPSGHHPDTGRRKYAADPEAQAVKLREWAARNPDAVRASRQRCNFRRRARLGGGFIEDVEALVVLERDDGACGICGEDVDPTNFQIDHIVPLAAGGWHAYDNVQAAHPLCNQRKGALSV